MADGSVLFFGGCVEDSCELGPESSSVDRYDPKTRTIARVGQLLALRTMGAVAALPDGGVLIAGGWSGGRTASIERFDPKEGVSRSVGQLSAAQVCLPVTLPDGRIVMMGHHTIDVIDPGTLRIRQISATSFWQESATATLLRDGRILVAGGRVTGQPVAEAYLFDPSSGRFSATGGLAAPRRKHAAVGLADGRVLIVGGSGADDRRNKTRALEVYNPTSGRFARVGETREARFKIPDAVIRLANGKVLVAGGAVYPELIDPKDWSARRVDFAFDAMLNFSAAAALPTGDVLVAGGYAEQTINPTDGVWIIPRALLA